MRVLLTVILGLAIASPALAQSSRTQRGTPVVPMYRLVTAESVIAVHNPADAARQLEEFRLVTSVGHFDVTCARELDDRAEPVGRQAEQAYQSVTASLRHELSLRPLLVLFATTEEMQRALRTRTVPGNREHVLVTLDTPAARLGGTLTHELSHVFLMDMLPASQYRQLPTWLIEGLAEFHRGEWDASDRAALKGLLLARTVPTLQTIRAAGQAADDRRSLILGHAMFDFLAERAGADGPRRLLMSLRQHPATTPLDAYLAAVGLTPDTFDPAFDAFLRTHFLP